MAQSSRRRRLKASPRMRRKPREALEGVGIIGSIRASAVAAPKKRVGLRPKCTGTKRRFSPQRSGSLSGWGVGLVSHPNQFLDGLGELPCFFFSCRLFSMDCVSYPAPKRHEGLASLKPHSLSLGLSLRRDLARAGEEIPEEAVVREAPGASRRAVFGVAGPWARWWAWSVRTLKTAPGVGQHGHKRHRYS